jgi:hypothetical protein
MPATVTLNPPVISGQSVTLTAQVHVPAGVGTSSGTVTFLVDGQPAGSAPLVNGSASFVVQNLGTGSHSFSVVYHGSGTTVTATSASQSATIPPVTTPTPTPTPTATPLPATATSSPATTIRSGAPSLLIKLARSSGKVVTLRITALEARDHVVKSARGHVAVRVLKGPHGGKVALTRGPVQFKNGSASIVLQATQAGHYTLSLGLGTYSGQIALTVGGTSPHK